MPPNLRGSVYRYDYGPNIGAELSGRRPALVISNDDFNHESHVVIVFPMTRTPPPELHSDNYVLVASTGSWASVRQVKSVAKGRLGAKIGEATSLEMEDVLETLAAHLVSSAGRYGARLMDSHSEEIHAGAIFDVEFLNEEHTLMLILDYNAGNGMAVAVEVEFVRRPNSPVRIPIEIVNSEEQASALIHRVRSIDVNARTSTRVGEISATSLMTVNSFLLAVMDQ